MSRQKNYFMVSIVTPNGDLSVVKGQFETYKEAERWCKKEAKDELGLNSTTEFFIFHARKRVTVVIDDNSADTEAFNELVKNPSSNSDNSDESSEETEVLAESPLESLEDHSDYSNSKGPDIAIVSENDSTEPPVIDEELIEEEEEEEEAEWPVSSDIL